jgi:hypothetical protein
MTIKSLKITFTFLTFFAAIISIIAFFSEDKISVNYNILSETNVLDLNADVNKLEIIYDSINLNRNDLNLKIYTLKVENLGNKSLSSSFYEVSDSIGLKIENGKIIAPPEIVQTSSKYLDEKLILKLNGESDLKFSQVILDPKEFFIIKLLVLHNTQNKPQILATGKIVSQKYIPVITAEIEKSEDKAFIEKIFEGSFLIQIIRFLFPLIIITGLVLILALSNGNKHEKKIAEWRNQNIYEFKNSPYYQEDYDYSKIFDVYKRYGTYPFLMLASFLENDSLLNSLFKNFKKEIGDPLPSIVVNSTTPFQKAFIFDVNWWLIEHLMKDGSILQVNENWIFEPSFKDRIATFIKFLNENGKFIFKDGMN